MSISVRHRVPHVLKSPRLCHNPVNLFFFDTETKDQLKGKNNRIKQEALWFGFVWAFRYRSSQVRNSIRQRFTTSDDFFSLLESRLLRDEPLYVFAHNIKFDLTQVDFWRQLDVVGMKVNYLVLEDPPILLSLTWKEKKVVIVDTFNFWKCSVAQMGDSLKIEKLPFPGYDASIKTWNRYCLRDVEILANQVLNLIDWLNKEQLGTFGISAPALAMSCYRKSFMKHAIYIHDRERVLQLERECYYGGMVENYFIGKSKNELLYHTDINSLYPFVMQWNYPCKLIGDEAFPKINVLRRLSNTVGACARVRIKSYENSYPKRVNGRLCFPIGVYDTYLCGRDLQLAFERGDITMIKHVAFYELAPIFKAYVDYFWAKRLEYKKQGDKVKDNLMKLLMNSLYGKFGMRGHDWLDWSYHVLTQYYFWHDRKCPKRYLKDDFLPIITQHQCNWFAEGLDRPIKIRYFGGKLQLSFPTGEHSESFCAIAAFVTAYARQLLLSYMDIAGKREVYYCDTDSLFVTELGYERLHKAKLIDEYTLGKLKREGESDHWAFYGPKDYVFGKKRKLKGVRSKARPLNASSFEQEQWEGLNSILKRGAEPYIEIKLITKTIKRLINKGVLQDNGRVTPIILHE